MTLEHIPLPAHTEQILTVRLPKGYSSINQTVWMSLAAVDHDQNEGNMSNIVSVRYMSDIANYMEEVAGPAECPSGTIIKCLDDLYFYIILAAATAFLLLLFILLVAFCCRRKKKFADDKKSLRTFDSPSSGSPTVEHVEDMDDILRSDLALHDQIQMTDEQIQTYRRQPLPSTKKRVQSIKWSKSLKRSSAKPKAPAPPPKPAANSDHPVVSKDVQRKISKQNDRLNPVWVSSKTNKAAMSKPTMEKLSPAGVQSERPAGIFQQVDHSTMPQDLQVGEQMCADLIASDNSMKNTNSEGTS